MKRTILAAAVALVAVAPRAHAQMANPIHVGVSAGVSFPTSDAIDDGSGDPYSVAKSKTGYNVNGLLTFQVPVFPLGLRAEIGYNKFQGKDITDGSGLRARADDGLLSGTLNAIIQPTSMLPGNPYLIGGIGAYNVKQEVRVSDSGDSFTDNDSRTSFGINGGVGVKFGLGTLSTFVEARYHYLFNDQKCTSSSSSCYPHKKMSFIPVSFGIMF